MFRGLHYIGSCGDKTCSPKSHVDHVAEDQGHGWERSVKPYTSAYVTHVHVKQTAKRFLNSAVLVGNSCRSIQP